MNDDFCRINAEIKYYEDQGSLVWVSEDLGQAFLLESIDLHLEVLACWEENCKLMCFLFCGQPFHLLLYFTSEGAQEEVRFLWDTSKKLKILVANNEHDDTLEVSKE